MIIFIVTMMCRCQQSVVYLSTLATKDTGNLSFAYLIAQYRSFIYTHLQHRCIMKCHLFCFYTNLKYRFSNQYFFLKVFDYRQMSKVETTVNPFHFFSLKTCYQNDSLDKIKENMSNF